MKPLMSDAEMRRRQKLQGKIGRTTSTLGLSGVALTGAAIATKKRPGALKAITKVPGLSRVSHGGLKNAAFHTSIAAGGIGGVGGFNQASIYSAESRKRKAAAVVKKGIGMEMGYYGEEGRPLTHEEIEAEIEKAWTPSASNFDSERSRHKRTGAYEAGAMATAGAGGAYAARHGAKAVKQGRKIRSIPDSAQLRTVTETVNAKTGKEYTRRVMRAGKRFRALDADVVGRTLKHGGKSAAGLAAVGGAAATHSAIKRKKNAGWQSYAKRDTTSAFGVDHSDEVSKAFNPIKAVKGFSAGRQAKAFKAGFTEHHADTSQKLAGHMGNVTRNAGLTPKTRKAYKTGAVEGANKAIRDRPRSGPSKPPLPGFLR